MIYCLVILLLCATAVDIRERRVPNVLVLVGLVLGAVLAPTYRLAMGHGWNWAPWWGVLAGLLGLMPLYLIRAMGAGDVKLLAMVGAFLGPAGVLAATLYTMFAGGVLALLFMLRPGVAAQTWRNLRYMVTDVVVRVTGGGQAQLAPLAKTAARLPYAVAISIGTAIAVWRHGML